MDNIKIDLELKRNQEAINELDDILRKDAIQQKTKNDTAAIKIQNAVRKDELIPYICL